MDDCLRERFVVIDDFLPEEQGVAMREDIDAHFSNPSRHEPATHQVWNYWYVPGSYTYLRTTPEKVIARAVRQLRPAPVRTRLRIDGTTIVLTEHMIADAIRAALAARAPHNEARVEFVQT